MTQGFTIRVDAFGETRTISEWAVIADQSARQLYERLRRGLPPEIALNIPRNARVDIDAEPGSAFSWTWEALDYVDDDWAQDFVCRNPTGATHEAVAYAHGLTRERIRQIEDVAIRKLERMGTRAVAWLNRIESARRDEKDPEEQLHALDLRVRRGLARADRPKLAPRMPASVEPTQVSAPIEVQQKEVEQDMPKIRPSNSFVVGEIAVGTTLMRKVMSDPDYKAIVRHPDFSPLFRKFLSMQEKIQEAAVQPEAEEARGAA